MKKAIHVNQHRIRSNLKNNKAEPVIAVKTYKGNIYGNRVEILGPSRVVYGADNPLSCGARVWIACECDVLVDGVKIK